VSNSAAAILGVVMGALFVWAIMAMFWGWLVMVVLGWLGVSVTWFQGWVIAFLVSGLCSKLEINK